MDGGALAGGVSRASTDGKSDEKEAEDSLSHCLQSMLDSEPYRRLSAVKESLARVYVLTTAKHLLSSLVKAKERCSRSRAPRPRRPT